MTVLIVEDEPGAAQNLCDLLSTLTPKIDVLAVLESVRETVSWLKDHPSPDLGFFDIRIADGNSFDIFTQTNIRFPVVFTTAYDAYALQAFRVNSVDYLLKPIDPKALKAALQRYRQLYQPTQNLTPAQMRHLLDTLEAGRPRRYRKSFLTYRQDKIVPISTDQIAFFFLHREMAFCTTYDQNQHQLNQSLQQIEAQVDPADFFRANRQYLVSRRSVQAAVLHFHRKLKLSLKPPPPDEVIVSKNKVGLFKDWLTG